MPHEQILVDTIAAAHATGRPAATLRTWANRGHLAPRGRDERGRTLYALDDIRRLHQARPAPKRPA